MVEVLREKLFRRRWLEHDVFDTFTLHFLSPLLDPEALSDFCKL